MRLEAFITGYSQAIQEVVPPGIMRRAEGIVAAHHPTGQLANVQAFAMAKVLIVDDDPTWVGICEDMAEEAGHEVTIATSADQAKDCIRKGRFALIVTDGLNDRWTEVHDAADDTKTVVISLSMSVQNEASKRRVDFIGKADNDWLQRLTGTFNIK